MDLQTYLTTKKLKPSQFAALIGKPASSITRILAGDRTPGLDLLIAIQEATKGQVTPNDFARDAGQKRRAKSEQAA